MEDGSTNTYTRLNRGKKKRMVKVVIAITTKLKLPEVKFLLIIRRVANSFLMKKISTNG